jgi:hypothetical protein
MKNFVLIAVLATVIFLLGATITSAADYSNWVLPGENFIFNNVNFTFTGHSESRDTITLRNNVSGTLVLELNKSIIWQGLEITYIQAKPNSTYLDPNYNMTDPHNLAEPYRFQISIDTITAALTAARTANNKVPYGELLNVSVAITNSGESDLQVTYTEEIPAYYKMEDKLTFVTDDVTNEWNSFSPAGQLYWKGTIKAGETTTLHYQYRVIGFKIGSDDISLKPGNVEYTYVGNKYNVNVPETSVEILRPFIVDISLSKDNIKINGETVFKITLTNAYDSAVDINSLKIYLPETCVPDGKIFGLDDKNADQEEGYYLWDGSLSSGRNQSFEIPVTAKYSGASDLVVNVTYRYNGYSSSDKFSKQLNVLVQPLVTQLYINTTQINAYDTYLLNFSALNTNRGLTFRNLRISIASADLFPTQHFNYPTVLYNSLITSNILVFNAPWVDAPKIYTISFEGTYETPNKQTLGFSINSSITVNPVQFNRLVDTKDIFFLDNENSELNMLNISLNLSLEGIADTNGSINYSESTEISDVRITILSENGTPIASHTLSDEELGMLKADKSQNMLINASLDDLNISNQNLEIRVQYNRGNITYFIKRYQMFIKKTQEAKINQSTPLETPPPETPPPEKGESLLTTLSQYTKSSIDNFGPLLILPGGLVVLIAIFMILYFQHVSKKKALIKEEGPEEENTYKRFIESQEIVLTEKQIKERSTGAIIAKNDPKNAPMPAGTQPAQGVTQSTQSYGTGIHDAGMMPKKASYNPVDLVPKPSYDFNELEKYIRTCTASGVGKKQMKKKLLDGGWMPEVIDVYLK